MHAQQQNLFVPFFKKKLQFSKYPFKMAGILQYNNKMITNINLKMHDHYLVNEMQAQ